MADGDMQLAGGEPAPPQGLIGRFLTEMSMSQRLGYLAAVALLVGGFMALMFWVNQPDYQVLYAGLNPRDAGAVVSKLKEMKIPYKLEASGQVIRVPSEVVYDTRLSLAGEGLPRGQGIGFEIFNEVQMGTTEFVQKINYQRALQGELARTISSFSAVEAARVHIVMPRESLFVEEEKKPSAGVVLRLAGGRRLSQGQIQGIVHLVASSVPELDPERISVVDSRGNLLYRKSADSSDSAAALTASQQEYQRNLERRLRQKVESMLEEVLGAGKASVRISADIDFTRISSVEQVYDPDRVAVRSETRSTGRSQGSGAAPAGSPDQRFALAARNATPNQGTAGSSTSQENETTNFEITTTKTQTLRPGGGLKRLSVAVVVDGTYKETKGKGDKVKRTYVPRTAEEMRQITALVRRAVGFDQKRGDVVTVENMPRAIAVDTAGMVGLPWWERYSKEYGRTALNLILGLLFFFMVVRPLLKYITARAPRPAETQAAPGAPRPVGPGEELPPGEEEALLAEAAATAQREMSVREQAQSAAVQDLDKATSVIRAWIHET